jgi:hypothetical protein
LASSCAVTSPRRSISAIAAASASRSHDLAEGTPSCSTSASVRRRSTRATPVAAADWTTPASSIGTTKTVLRMASIRTSVRRS